MSFFIGIGKSSVKMICRTRLPLTSFAQGDCSWEDNLYRDPSTSKANAFFAQDDQMGGLSLDKC